MCVYCVWNSFSSFLMLACREVEGWGMRIIVVETLLIRSDVEVEYKESIVQSFLCCSVLIYFIIMRFIFYKTTSLPRPSWDSSKIHNLRFWNNCLVTAIVRGRFKGPTFRIVSRKIDFSATRAFGGEKFSIVLCSSWKSTIVWTKTKLIQPLFNIFFLHSRLRAFIMMNSKEQFFMH